MERRAYRYVELLRTYLAPQWRQVLLLLALLLTGIALELINPQILRRFIDTATGGGTLGTLGELALLFLGVALGYQVITVLETYVAENLGLLATNQMRADLMRHCLQLDPGFHLAHTPGELIERVDGDVATLGNFFSRLAVHLISNALLLAGVLVLLFRIDWRVGLALTLFTLVALFAITQLRDIGVPHWTAAREANAGLFGFIEERLSGTEDIRTSGATGYVMRRLTERSRTLLSKQRSAGLMGSVTGSTTIVLFALGTAVALGLGAYLYISRGVTLGTVYLIFNYTELLSRPIEQITRQMQDLQKATASIGRVQELLAIRSSISDGSGADLPDGAASVTLDRVTFGYGDDTPVLSDVSLTIAPGTVLGLLGRTGSGKTTLTRLLLRLYDPRGGAIRLNGVDLRELRIADLRRHVGMVTQDIHLFHATIRDNLTFFDRSISDERIMAVLDQLGLVGWLASQAEGLDTRLPPGGGGLSAGEGQLLAFARVFLKDPGLVILDEASSRLDPATEQQVERAVSRLLEGRTGIIIAHRLQTVQRADAILILERGRTLEYGPRAALAADPDSRFAQLLQAGMAEALA